MPDVKEDKETKKNKRTVRIFAAASFFNDLGSDIIYPVWPLFITTVMGANMAVLGFLDGLGDALVSISQAAAGYVSDRIRKRKVFVWVGYIMGSGSRIGYAFSSVWQNLIPFRILDRTGKIRGAPRDAIIADVSTDENRGANFGLLRAADNLGAICGIAICILFFKMLGYKKLFLLAAIPSLVGAFLVIFLVREKKTERKIYKGLTFRDIDTNFRLFLILSSFFALGSFSYSFLLIYAKTAGFRIAFIPVFYLLFTAIAFAASIPFGRLSDRIGRKSVIMISFFMWGLVCVNCILFRAYWAVVMTFVLYGAHRGAIEPAQKAFVSELVPAQYRAGSLGAFQMVIGLCALPASLFAGLLWDKIGEFLPFCLSLLLTVVATAMLFFVKEKRNDNGKKSI